MYHSVKTFFKKIIPKRFLKNHEFTLRRLAALRYRGSAYQCNLCFTRLHHFISLKNTDLLCPACGSRSRTRRLFDILQSEHLLHGNVLEFSPSSIMARELGKINAITYYSSDYLGEFSADYQYDITNIDCNDAFFELILCYHILEHIKDDNKAMHELYRVLKPNGFCLVQTPFKDGLIYENSAITTPTGRLEHFGQEDHVRVYSVEGLKGRLENVGFTVNVLQFETPEHHFNGFKSETILMLKK